MGKIYTEAQKKANYKYNSRFNRLNIRIEPGLKQELDLYCKAHNISVNSLVINLIEKTLRNN
ncbi:MAG: toxin-antitoxin system HicB family antitoxin [Lachnospiraceae bacterium]|nr:toxin-antitoxin system HicB family antitoxin [Lachnospiraceae bacterium]